MNTLLLFFALPLATILLSVVLEKILRKPFLVALTFFAIYLIVTFSLFSTDFLINTIVYTILAYVSAILTEIVCKLLNGCRKISVLDDSTISIVSNNSNENSTNNSNNSNCNCSNNSNNGISNNCSNNSCSGNCGNRMEGENVHMSLDEINNRLGGFNYKSLDEIENNISNKRGNNCSINGNYPRRLRR